MGGNLTGTEWWVYHIYYNAEGTDGGEVNSVYQILNVRENSMNRYKVKYNAVGENEDGSFEIIRWNPHTATRVPEVTVEKLEAVA